MNWVHLFTSFEGRISRQTFWIGWAFLVAADIALWIGTRPLDDDRISAVADLILTYPQFAVSVKRGHDRNTPTWVIGLFFAASVVFDLLQLGGWITPASLERQTPVMTAILIAVAIFALVLIIDLGFRRGTVGPNRYGPDPLDGQS